MNKTVVTRETGLRIWPTCSFVSFLIHGGKVFADFDRPPFVPDVTPSSVKVSDVYNDGRYRKTLTFRVPDCSEAVCSWFFSLLKTYVVAVYTDERGVNRMMGSPLWPASLSFERTGGSIRATLEAWGDAPNPEFSGPRR